MEIRILERGMKQEKKFWSFQSYNESVVEGNNEILREETSV